MPDQADKFENLAETLLRDSEREFLPDLLSQASAEEADRSKNLLNSERWFKKRFGIRPQIMLWPWRDSSNLHMPLVDKTIRRNKPSFANLVGTTYPTVILESTIPQDDPALVRGVEREFHTMLFDEDRMNIFPDLAWGIDLMLERGRFITKVIQEFTLQIRTEEIILRNLSQDMLKFLLSPSTTDEMLALELILRYSLDPDDEMQKREIRSAIRQLRDAKEVIRFQRKVNLTPWPTLCVRDPNTVLFPKSTTFNISKALWIRDSVPLSEIDIEQRIESGTWHRQNARELLDRITRGKDGINARYNQRAIGPLPAGTAELERQREGISSTPTGTLPVFNEFYCWKKLPGENFHSQVVISVHPDHPDLPLRMIRYPYVLPDGRPDDWPFDQIQAEIVSDRAYGPRGYPQMLDSLQTEVTNNHNAKQNWMTIANSLNIKAKRNSGVTTQYIPGQPLWVNRMDDADVLNVGSRDLSFDNEERILTGWAEQYIGLLDQTLTNVTGSPERRTKAEVDAVSALQAQVVSLDVRIFQSFMQRTYRKVWNRWLQYGPEEIQIQGAGGQSRTVSKADLRGRLRLRTAGDIFSTNRQLKTARMANVFQVLRGDPRIDQDRLYRAWLTLEDERLAEEVLISGAQVQQAHVERTIDDIRRINEGYVVIPRPSDDNKVAMEVIKDYMSDPVKNRNFKPDRLETLRSFYAAHELALQKKNQATTRPGRAEQEVAQTAMGMTGREAREPQA